MVLNEVISQVKTCKSCTIEKETSYFENNRSVCKKCRGILNKQASHKKSIEIERDHKERITRELKLIFDNDNASEIWKDIPKYEGKYQVSNLGHIRCLPSLSRNKADGRIKIIKSYNVKPTPTRGYLHTVLTDMNGNHKTRGNHRWVMYAFHGESDLQVDHINGIKDDNRLENLRYLSARDNINHIKTLNPEKYTTSLVGTYRNIRGRWVSNITINTVCYHLGMYDTDIEASTAYKLALDKWNEKEELPNYINPNRTSSYEGIDLHKMSGKWRVRGKNKEYIGIFNTEDTAIRVLLLIRFLENRDCILSKELISKIRRKYAIDNRLIKNKLK